MNMRYKGTDCALMVDNVEMPLSQIEKASSALPQFS
jgi:hypothetical protein